MNRLVRLENGSLAYADDGPLHDAPGAAGLFRQAMLDAKDEARATRSTSGPAYRGASDSDDRRQGDSSPVGVVSSGEGWGVAARPARHNVIS